MSLQIWLPLNGNLDNKGCSDLTFSITNSTYTKLNTSGKIGSCYENTNNKAGGLISDKIIDLGQYQSMCCWINVTSFYSSSSLMGIGGQHRYLNNNGMGLTLKYISASSGYLSVNTGTGSSRTYNTYTGATLLHTGIWYHVCYTYDGTNIRLYVNGNLDGTHLYPDQQSYADYIGLFCWSLLTGAHGLHDNYQFNGKINDFRVYDHCLSAAEVKEISKGLILHYPLSNGIGNENLFRDSNMAINYSFVANNSTNWTKYFRYYNGNTSKHTIVNGEDTILLNTAQNLGICFQRKATDIGLDSSSYYTISCEAKCSKAGAHLDIGLSYRNTSGTWVWRGGTNSQYFTDVNTWQKFTLKFKPDSNTGYICYCFTMLGTNGGKDTLTIRHCKLEKGEVATPYSLSTLDREYGDNTIIYDASGNGYDGEITGKLTPVYDSARYYTSSLFNGATRIVAEGLPTETKTISIWSKTTWDSITDNQYQIIFQNKKTNLCIGFGSSGLISYTGTGAGGTGSYVSIKDEYIANQWNHIVVVKTADTTRNVYVNGKKMTSIANNYFAGDSNLSYLGCRHINSNYAHYFTGQLSDFRAYATVLSEDDIKELYQTSAKIDKNGTLHTYELVEDQEVMT